jgi:hypothetical protein
MTSDDDDDDDLLLLQLHIPLLDSVAWNCGMRQPAAAVQQHHQV